MMLKTRIFSIYLKKKWENINERCISGIPRHQLTFKENNGFTSFARKNIVEGNISRSSFLVKLFYKKKKQGVVALLVVRPQTIIVSKLHAVMGG